MRHEVREAPFAGQATAAQDAASTVAKDARLGSDFPQIALPPAAVVDGRVPCWVTHAGKPKPTARARFMEKPRAKMCPGGVP